MYKATERLYLDKDGNVTTDEAKAYSLLVSEGGELSDEDAEKYGLDKRKSAKPAKDADETESKDVKEAPETKHVKAPAASKGKAHK